ncbi:hypothetical protein PAMA_014229 [Pampus argenteus]
MDGFYDQQVPFVVPESKCHTEEVDRCLSDRKRKFMDTGLAQDTEELFQDLIQLQEIWIAEAQVPDDEQFVPDFQSNNLMFHGLPVSKVKREHSPSKDLSPCRTPHADMCLYSYSACDNKSAGRAGAPPASSLAVQCGATHPSGPPPLQRQLHPSTPQLTNNPISSLSPSHHHSLPQDNQNQQFALPRPPINRPAGSFSTEQRFQRQLSEPCLSFLPPENATNTAYSASSRDGRPLYQRHLSEPLVPHAPRGFKQELVDPRYPEPGPPGPRLAPPQTTYNHVTIKQEPRDFGFDSEVQTCQSSSLFGKSSVLYQNNRVGFGCDREPHLYYDDTCVVPDRLEVKVKQEGLPYQRRGSLQLWQFLLTLLDNPANGHLIVWTGRNMEFKLIDPEETEPKGRPGRPPARQRGGRSPTAQPRGGGSSPGRWRGAVHPGTVSPRWLPVLDSIEHEQVFKTHITHVTQRFCFYEILIQPKSLGLLISSHSLNKKKCKNLSDLLQLRFGNGYDLKLKFLHKTYILHLFTDNFKTA